MWASATSFSRWLARNGSAAAQNSVNSGLRDTGECRVQSDLAVRPLDTKLKPERARSVLHLPRLVLGVGIGRIDQYGHGRDLRHHLVKQPEPFRLDLGGEHAYAGHIAAGPVHACDDAEFDRVAAEVEDDRNLRSRCFGGERGLLRGGGDNVHAALDEIGRESRQAFIVAVSPAIFDLDVPTVDIALF